MGRVRRRNSDLQQMAAPRGYEIVHRFTQSDLRDWGRSGKKKVLLELKIGSRARRSQVRCCPRVWACEQGIARSRTRYFLDVLDDTLNRLNIEFIG